MIPSNLVLVEEETNNRLEVVVEETNETIAAPGTIYTSGHPVSRFRRSWFPEYEFGGTYTRNVKSNTNDILMVGMYGGCANTFKEMHSTSMENPMGIL